MPGCLSSGGMSDSVHTTIQSGVLRGAREGAGLVFRRIPFAAPPTGDLRLRPPAPPAPWTGEREAVAPGPAPPQIADPLSETLGLDFPGPISEDCLHLNVWTPGTQGRRPVLVWIHGGAFATGSGTSPAYSGARIAERGDVVVVTLNYRVGALGFLPIGSEGGDGRANLGLLDQIAALEWVKREISRFGGDPDRVTVFGESAGAGSIVALLAMPAARGLFGRAIIQSPAPDGILTLAEGRERAQMLARHLGDETPAKAPLARLLEAQQACIAAGPHRTGMFFAPVVDGETLPIRPLDAIAQGEAADVEILIGTAEEEMQLYATIPGMGDFPDEILQKVVASRLPGDEAERDALAARAVSRYREELGAPSQRELFFALETDLSLRLPSTRLAESHAAVQPGTWMYLFQWRSPMSDGHGGTLGACHALDLPFTFGALESDSARRFATGDDPERQRLARTLSDRMIDAWTSFARDGDPRHPGLGDWRPYEPKKRWTQLLGEECRCVEAPLERRRRVWEG